MKVGVVSVTVEQHTEGQLQDSESTLNVEMALYQNGVIQSTCRGLKSPSVKDALKSSSEGCGQHLIIAVPLVLGSETAMSL